MPLAFGNYTATAALDSTTTLSVACSATTPFTIGLNAGAGTGATVAQRRMSNGASQLNYTLSSDAARSVNIGQTVGTDTVPGTGTGLVQNVTIYGRVLPNQLVTPGVYNDTVTATITY